MFITKNQFYIATACIAFGFVFAIILGIFSVVKFFIKDRIIKAILDVVLFVIMAVMFRVYAFMLNFPNVRLYMFLCVFIGILAYFKSLHILLAKNMKKFYNILRINFIKLKKAKDERIKVKKVDSCNNGRGSIVSGNIVVDNGISTNINTRRKQKNRKTRVKNRRI